MTTSDRDGDGLDDTVELEFDVLSNAFFEDLDVAVAVRDGTGAVVDTLDTRVEAGGGQPVSTSVFFTPNADGQYSFEFTMRDLLGNVVDETTSAPLTVANMRPVSNGNVSTNVTLSWNDLRSLAMVLTHGVCPSSTTPCRTSTPPSRMRGTWGQPNQRPQISRPWLSEHWAVQREFAGQGRRWIVV